MTTADGRSSAHPRTRLPRLVGSVLAGVLALAACSTTTPVDVVVDPSLTTGEVYEVTRHWTSLDFGPFRTERTDVSASTEYSVGGGGDEEVGYEAFAGVTTARYRFDFAAESGERWHVDCRSPVAFRGWRTGLGSANLQSSRRVGEIQMACALLDPRKTIHSLEVRGGAGGDYVGKAEFGADAVAIRTLHELPARDGGVVTIPGPLGFELRHGDRAVAAVDFLYRVGRVYLARDLPQTLRTQVALTAAVLLLSGGGGSADLAP